MGWRSQDFNFGKSDGCARNGFYMEESGEPVESPSIHLHFNPWQKKQTSGPVGFVSFTTVVCFTFDVMLLPNIWGGLEIVIIFVGILRKGQTLGRVWD